MPAHLEVRLDDGVACEALRNRFEINIDTVDATTPWKPANRFPNSRSV